MRTSSVLRSSCVIPHAWKSFDNVCPAIEGAAFILQRFAE